jgi:hypothetical protein
LTLSGANVTQWRDKSGNARHANAIVSPTYSANAVVFNRAAFTGFNTSLSASTNVESGFIVTTCTNVTVQNTMLGGTSTGGRQFRNSSILQTIKQDVVGVLATGTSLTSGVQYLFGYVNTGTTLVHYMFGGVYASGTSVAYDAARTTTIGRRGDNLEAYSGSMNEIIIFNSALSDAQRQQVEGYLARKWGLLGTLPATHPYKALLAYTRPTIPLDIPGCQLWLDAADPSTVTLSGTNVTQWMDKSGNGNTAVAGTATYPVYQTGALNSLPIITMRGTNDYFLVSTTNLNPVDFPSLCYFIVMRPASTQTTNFAGVLSTSSTASRWGRSLGLGSSSGTIGDLFQQGYYSSLANIVSLTRETWYVVSLQFTSTTSATLTANGTSTAGAASATGTNSQGFKIGSYDSTSSYVTYNANFDVAEILVYGANLSVAQRQQLESYLGWKWNLRGNLISTQPYRLIPSLTPAFTPLQIAGCQLWFDAADTGTITGTTTITNWRNKGALGGSATNLTGSCTSGNTIRGLNYVQCPSGTALQFTLALNTQARSWFFVSRKSTPLSSGQLVFLIGTTTGGGQNSIDLAYLSATTYTVRSIAQGIVVSLVGNVLTSTTTDVNVLSVINSATIASNVISLNGSIQTLTTSSAANSYNTSSAQYTINTAGSNQAIDIMEILFFYGDLSRQNRQQVEGYLAAKWGLVPNLPSTHPYAKITP